MLDEILIKQKSIAGEPFLFAEQPGKRNQLPVLFKASGVVVNLAADGRIVDKEAKPKALLLLEPAIVQ